MTPSQIGERAEAALIAALVQAGKTIYLPIGGSQRADLVFEDETGLHRVQVKSGSLDERVVIFATCSNTKNVPKDYRGEIDYFGVYCHELGAAFLVPVDGTPLRSAQLRLGPTRNNQTHKIRWAEQYRLDWTPPVLKEGWTLE